MRTFHTCNSTILKGCWSISLQGAIYSCIMLIECTLHKTVFTVHRDYKKKSFVFCNFVWYYMVQTPKERSMSTYLFEINMITIITLFSFSGCFFSPFLFFSFYSPVLWSWWGGFLVDNVMTYCIKVNLSFDLWHCCEKRVRTFSYCIRRKSKTFDNILVIGHDRRLQLRLIKQQLFVILLLYRQLLLYFIPGLLLLDIENAKNTLWSIFEYEGVLEGFRPYTLLWSID